MEAWEVHKAYSMWSWANGGPAREQRFGQWFLNSYFPEARDPDLFYEVVSGKALRMILDSRPQYCYNGA